MKGSSIVTRTVCRIATLILLTAVAAISSTATTTRSRQQSLSSQTTTLNLRDFGAIGDGVANDGPALQEALNALALAGGGTLFVPEGEYRLTTPVLKQFNPGVSISINGEFSETPIDVAGNGSGLNLRSKFIVAVGPTNNALTLSGLDTLFMRDILFEGVETVTNDAHVVLTLSQIKLANVIHCEFYGLASLVNSGGILQADNTELNLQQSAFLGCATNSGAYTSVVQATNWIGLVIHDCKFVDYGSRSFFSKTPLAPPFAWIMVGNALPPTASYSRREAIVDNVFMDEGAYTALSSRPDRFVTNFPQHDLYLSRLYVNVNNLYSDGISVYRANRVFIDRSHFGWSSRAGFAITLTSVNEAILDLIDTSNDATRFRVSADRLTVINSTYTSLDSTGPITNVITTQTADEDPAQFVRQQYLNALQRDPDAAGHFYWANKLLLCGNDSNCLTQTRGDLQTFLAADPPPKITATGSVTDENGIPVEGVTVNLGGSETVSTQTDGEGKFVFNRIASAGQYTISLYKEHCESEQFSFVTPTSDKEFDLTFSVLRYSISGRVFSKTGQNVAGAQVSLTGGQQSTTFSDDDGTFAFANLPAGSDYTVTVSRNNYDFEVSQRSVSDLSTNLSFAFEGVLKNYTISGIVKKANGTPISNATVRIGGDQAETQTTDSEGRYSFTSKAEGDYTVFVSHPNNVFAQSQTLFSDLSANQNADFVAVPELRISGKIRNAGGFGLPGVSLTVTGTIGALATTDNDGNYYVDLPSGGNYTLTPVKSGYSFTASSVSVANLSTNQTNDFLASAEFGIPIILPASDPTRALALDLVYHSAEPFNLMYDLPWSDDRRTRIIVFVTNFNLLATDTTSDFTADVEDSLYRVYPLSVEFAGKLDENPSFVRLVLRIENGLTEVGDVKLRVRYKGITSEPLSFGIGFIGTTPN